ncbi:MAG: hypothetical protein WA188_12855 [Terriglobales bacterium]
MKASIMAGPGSNEVENEFQFQWFKNTCRRRARSIAAVTARGDANHNREQALSSQHSALSQGALMT